MSGTRDTVNQLADFRLTKKLGEGGMGAVFKARQISMDRDVALKILPKHLAKDPNFVDRFYREARASAKLDHPNIVRGIAVGEDRGFHYFAMEYIDGESASRLLEQLGKFQVGDAVKIATDVARALEHAHAKGLVHRDIKPDNIMVTRDGVVKLADLGLTKETEQDSGLTQTGSGFGTPYYMAPEQARNAKHVDQRSDIYSLGATLYNMLTGCMPYEGETAMEVLSAKEQGSHAPARRHNPDVPEILDLVIDKMMAKDPSVRFQTASELVAALDKSGLAAASLSWVGQEFFRGPASGATRTATAVTAKTEVAGQRSVPTAPPAERYYIRYKDRRGELRKLSGDRHQIRDMIRKGLLTSDVQGAREPNGPFRPLMAFPEFSELVKSRFIKETSDKASGGMAQQIDRYDREETRRRKMRKIKRLVRQVLTAVIVIGVIVAGVYFAWHYQSGKNSAAAPSAGGAAPSPAPPGTVK